MLISRPKTSRNKSHEHTQSSDPSGSGTVSGFARVLGSRYHPVSPAASETVPRPGGCDVTSFAADFRVGTLEATEATPLGRAFLIPFRLDDCQVPPEFAARAQWVDGFPDLERGAMQVDNVIGKSSPILV